MSAVSANSHIALFASARIELFSSIQPEILLRIVSFIVAVLPVPEWKVLRQIHPGADTPLVFYLAALADFFCQRIGRTYVPSAFFTPIPVRLRIIPNTMHI